MWGRKKAVEEPVDLDESIDEVFDDLYAELDDIVETADEPEAEVPVDFEARVAELTVLLREAQERAAKAKLAKAGEGLSPFKTPFESKPASRVERPRSLNRLITRVEVEAGESRIVSQFEDNEPEEKKVYPAVWNLGYRLEELAEAVSKIIVDPDTGEIAHTHDDYFPKSGGDLASGGAFIGTNRLKPQGAGANTLYEGTAYSHPQALINSGMMKEYAAEKDHGHDALDTPPPVHVGDDPPENPDEGDLWYDTNRLEMFIRYEDGWVTTNALGARIEAGEEIQRDLQARVAAGEAEQEILQAKVNALEGSTGTHPYILSDNGNPREGQVTPSTSQSQVTTNVHEVGYLAFNLKDANGRDVDADRAQGDDMIRFTDQHGNIVEYQIDGGGYEGFFLIAGLLRSEFDTFVVGDKYDVSWHSQFDPSGLATIKYVDQRDATKISLSGENVVDTSWRLKNGGATIFSTATSGKIKIYNLEAPTNWSHAANKDYVDDHVAPTWHFKRNPANSHSEKGLYWFDANETTRQFAISGVPMLGRRIQMINGLNSAEGAPRELMTISGKKNGKQVFLAIAPVRSWTMTSSIIVLRVNSADMLHWDPDAFDNDDPVTVKFGGLF
jgi:hypothetical protein